MKINVRWGSHLPVLMGMLKHTTGPVLEMGMGLFSTPYLHHECMLQQRRLLSYDNHEGYINICAPYASSLHEIRFITSWDDAVIEEPWDVVLIDHAPAERRVTDIARLKDLARYMVIHDTNGRGERFYHYRQIWPWFKYVAHFGTTPGPSTSVVSNIAPIPDEPSLYPIKLA